MARLALLGLGEARPRIRRASVIASMISTGCGMNVIVRGAF